MSLLSLLGSEDQLRHCSILLCRKNSYMHFINTPTFKRPGTRYYMFVSSVPCEWIQTRRGHARRVFFGSFVGAMHIDTKVFSMHHFDKIYTQGEAQETGKPASKDRGFFLSCSGKGQKKSPLTGSGLKSIPLGGWRRQGKVYRASLRK